MDVIDIENLTKSYRYGWPGKPPIMALRELSLSVRKGEIYGFLGPNGAGKTTTLKILMGLMRASSGRAEILGKLAGDVATRKRVGFLPESPYFYDYLTAREFLWFYGNLAGLGRTDLHKRVTQLLELVGLIEAEHRQLRKFSKGMLQRVGLAQSIIHDPDLIILDEPMSGLDPIGRKQIRDLIVGLREEGKTIFFSSHIIPDVEMICDRVGIVMKGKLVAHGRVDELVGLGHSQSVEVVCSSLRTCDMEGITQVASRVLLQGSQALIVLSPNVVDEVLNRIRALGGKLISVTPQKRSLEELFIQQADNHAVTCAGVKG